MSRRDPEVSNEALRAVIAWARDAALRPMQQRGMWMQRILVVLTPAGLAVALDELLKRREAERGS